MSQLLGRKSQGILPVFAMEKSLENTGKNGGFLGEELQETYGNLQPPEKHGPIQGYHIPSETEGNCDTVPHSKTALKLEELCISKKD